MGEKGNVTSKDLFPPRDMYTREPIVPDKPLSAFKMSPKLTEGDAEVIIVYRRRTGGWHVAREVVRKVTARKLSLACTSTKKQIMKTVNAGG